MDVIRRPKSIAMGQFNELVMRKHRIDYKELQDKYFAATGKRDKWINHWKELLGDSRWQREHWERIRDVNIDELDKQINEIIPRLQELDGIINPPLITTTNEKQSIETESRNREINGEENDPEA